VNYESDLESQNASVVFSFDGVYVRHDPITLNFTVKGRTSKVTYLNMTTTEKFFENLLFSLTVCALFMVVCCSWLRKMVGV
jgi:hypothetical protein